jgi:hypothetical protein
MQTYCKPAREFEGVLPGASKRIWVFATWSRTPLKLKFCYFWSYRRTVGCTTFIPTWNTWKCPTWTSAWKLSATWSPAFKLIVFYLKTDFKNSDCAAWGLTVKMKLCYLEPSPRILDCATWSSEREFENVWLWAPLKVNFCSFGPDGKFWGCATWILTWKHGSVQPGILPENLECATAYPVWKLEIFCAAWSLLAGAPRGHIKVWWHLGPH